MLGGNRCRSSADANYNQHARIVLTVEPRTIAAGDTFVLDNHLHSLTRSLTAIHQQTRTRKCGVRSEFFAIDRRGKTATVTKQTYAWCSATESARQTSDRCAQFVFKYTHCTVQRSREPRLLQKNNGTLTHARAQNTRLLMLPLLAGRQTIDGDSDFSLRCEPVEKWRQTVPKK